MTTQVEELRGKIVSLLQEDKTLDLRVGTDIGPVTLQIAELAIEHFRTIHSRAIACHCECLAMNAENCYAACRSSRPPYRDADYHAVMQKWGLINEKGEPLI